MKSPSLSHLSIAVAIAGGAEAFITGGFDRAESNLKIFYTKVQATDFQSARTSIDEAVRLWPSNARYHAWRGYQNSQDLPSQCMGRGSTAETKVLERLRVAAADYRRALDLNSRDAVAHHNLAWLNHLQGLDNEARQHWELAIETDPATAIYRLSFGLFLEEQGELEAADGQFASAIGQTPIVLDSPFFARLSRRTAFRAEAIVTQAQSTLERRLGTSNDPILKARLGKIAFYRGELEKAAALLLARPMICRTCPWSGSTSGRCGGAKEIYNRRGPVTTRPSF